MPTKFDGSTLMTRMWRECVLPEAELHYTAALEEVQHRAVKEISPDTLIQGEQSQSSNSGIKPRSIFTFDGCWQQLNSVMTVLNDEFTERSYEGFKFAAASTMVEQPNDVGHCHKAIKEYFKHNTYRKTTIFQVPDNMWGFDDIMKAAGLEAASLHTYWKALCHMELRLSKTCTLPMVREGYKISGIFPININTIMSGWSGWTLCPRPKASEVLARIPSLVEIAKQKGRVTDK